MFHVYCSFESIFFVDVFLFICDVQFTTSIQYVSNSGVQFFLGLFSALKSAKYSVLFICFEFSLYFSLILLFDYFKPLYFAITILMTISDNI